MKKVFFISACLLSLAAVSQSDKYIKAMEPKVAALDTTRSADALKDLANAFERIGDAEKTQWLPYYYAALANVDMGYALSGAATGGTGTPSQIDPIADKAEDLLNKAEALSKDNAEIYIVKKMLATMRMAADPQNRYMKYGPIASQALDTAKKISPDNPRVFLLEGEDKYFTPEQFGGNKEEAKKLFEEAVQKFDSFKPESNIAPHWGLSTTQYFLSQMKS